MLGFCGIMGWNIVGWNILLFCGPRWLSAWEFYTRTMPMKSPQKSKMFQPTMFQPIVRV
jgi:hypothetical protein